MDSVSCGLAIPGTIGALIVSEAEFGVPRSPGLGGSAGSLSRTANLPSRLRWVEYRDSLSCRLAPSQSMNLIPSPLGSPFRFRAAFWWQFMSTE